jgi:hypothetical protein
MTVEKYVHHGREVFVNSEVKGKHRDHCLCFACKKFKPDTSENCPIANDTFENCKKHHLVTPVYECPSFE